MLQLSNADFNVEISGSCNDVLSCFCSEDLYELVNLRELLESSIELVDVDSSLGLDSYLDNRSYGKLHMLEGHGGLASGANGCLLKDSLVDSSNDYSVSTRHTRNGFELGSHTDTNRCDTLDSAFVSRMSVDGDRVSCLEGS